MELQQWRDDAARIKAVLQMERYPVALFRGERKKGVAAGSSVRICRAIVDAAEGHERYIDRRNNACFGAVWHLGLQRIEDSETLKMIKKFVVEGEKLFSSYEALEELIAQMGDIPDSAQIFFNLCPLERASTVPELVLFLCNAEQACRLLTLVTFVDGVMPSIK